MVAMQRAAESAGLAHLDPSTHLSIHPTFGAWLSLRAVVVFDLQGLGRAPPAPPEVALSQAERDEASAALQRAIARSSGNLCEELHGPVHREGGQESCDRGAPAWREWVALRDVVRLGRRYRFCEDQIEYHYTKDRAKLKAAVLRPAQ
jgi:methylmalonic aciduria homocystinuria type C protein